MVNIKKIILMFLIILLVPFSVESFSMDEIMDNINPVPLNYPGLIIEKIHWTLDICA